MVRPVDPKRLARDLASCTGVEPRRVADGLRFRVRCRTSDGHDHAIGLQIDTHARETRPYVVGQLAAALHLPKDEVLERIATWTPADLLAHLATFTKDELTPPRNRPGRR